MVSGTNEPAQDPNGKPQEKQEQNWFKRNAKWIGGLIGGGLVLEVAYSAFINKNHKPVLGKFTAWVTGAGSKENAVDSRTV